MSDIGIIIKDLNGMRESIWLEWFCRRAAEAFESNNPSYVSLDIRRSFANYVKEGTVALSRRAAPEKDRLELLWYASLWPFAAGFIDHAPKNPDDSPPIALLLTRGTALLLGGARAPFGVDQQWRSALQRCPAVYIDVHPGTILIESTNSEQKIQLRALLLLGASNSVVQDKNPFIAILTDPGSDRPRARLLGYLDTDEQSSNGLGRVADADFTLKPPHFDHSIEQTVRTRAADFLRLVLAYYLFGPKEIQEIIPAASINKLRDAKPPKGKSLFTITRLRPSRERLGRPLEATSLGWSLTSRQEVSGHFRLQPYGPANTLRRLIWVASYERGPEESPHRVKAVQI